MISIGIEHPGAAYEVLVGDLARAADRMAAIGDGRLLPLVSDPHVHALHGARLAELCLPRPILLPRGEAAKGWDGLRQVIDGLAELDVRRGTPIVALGGGSVGDVAGLAAALFKRGCPVIHVPTTLLAQADSAVGGKTAVDAAGQKNLAGLFHHPALVVADPAFLDTLDQRQLRAGYAEVVKYGLIDDPSFFLWCQEHYAGLLAGDRDARRFAIEHCLRAKARFVTADPEDRSGFRALLNLGHSFGHAIEAAASLGEVLHGEAVAAGIVLAFRFSAALGLCLPDDARIVRNHFAAAGLPTDLRDLGLGGRAADIFGRMQQDKKAERSGMALVLVKGIGKAVLVNGVDPRRLHTFLQEVD